MMILVEDIYQNCEFKNNDNLKILLKPYDIKILI